MALNFIQIDAPLWVGIDTKTDPKQVGMNNTLKLENAVAQKTGEISKRHGYEELGTGTTYATSTNNAINGELESINSIHSHKNQLVLVASDTGSNDDEFGGHIYTRNEETNEWMSAGEYVPVTFTTERISRPSTTIQEASVAEGNGFRAYAYLDDDDSCLNILDSNTGTVYKDHLVFQATSSLPSPKVVYIPDGYGKNFLCVGSRSTGTISGLYANAEEPQLAGTTVSNITTNLHHDNLWDMTFIDYPAHTVGNNQTYPEGTEIDGYREALLVFKRANDARVQFMNLDGHGNVKQVQILNIQPKNCLAVQYINDPDYGGRVWIMYQDKATGGMDAYGFTPALTQVIAQSHITTDLAARTARNVTMALEPEAGAGAMLAFIGVDNSFGESKYSVYLQGVNHNASDSAIGREMFGVGLASRAFTWENQAFALAAHQSSAQSTYFLISLKEHLKNMTVAKVFYGLGGGVRQINGLSEVITEIEGLFTVAVTRQSRLKSDNVRDYQVAGITFDMNPLPLTSVSVGSDLLIGGGVITGYDRSAQELGFHLYPEGLVFPSPASSTLGSMSDGYVVYQAVYAWTDRNGQVYKSAPSEFLGRTYSAGTHTQSDILRVPTYGQTNQLNKGNFNLKLEIYRTLPGGDTFYLETSSSTTGATTGSQVNQRVGTDSDDALSNNEILYTTGGVLPNIAPPASNILVANKNRVFLVPMDDLEAIWFSKEKISGIGWEFSDELVLRVDKDGDNTSLAVMNDKIIVFKERAIYYFSGQGPNDLGTGGAFYLEQVPTDVGCVDGDSIITFPDGVMFKSHKGIYLLDQSLGVSYIGAPVEDYNQFDILDTELVEEQNQIRFAMSGGNIILVYDYYHHQWSTFNNMPIKDAVIHRGTYHYVRQTAAAIRKEAESFNDHNTVITMKVRTAWYHLGGIQNFQRVSDVAIIGKFQSNHTITVRVYTDYDENTITQTITRNTTDFMSGSEPYQFAFTVKEQKCQAIQFEIFDDDQLQTLESMKLSKITFTYGQKKGMFKMPTRKF